MTITVNQDNRPTSFNGENAVDVFRLRCLHSSLGLLASGIKPCRGFTIKHGLTLATEYTGKPYKRTQLEEAMTDLKKIEMLRVRHIDIVQD